MVDYRRTPIIDDGIAVNLAETSDEELEELIRHSHNKVFNTNVVASWEAATLLLAMFHCRGCGKCCRGVIFAQPVLPLVPGEPSKIANYVGCSAKQFRQFCTHKDSTLYLKLPCPFYQQGRCTIYQVRPVACQLFSLQGAIRVNGNPPSFVLDLSCPSGSELAIKLVKLRKATFRLRQGGGNG